jgi:hypothetical protein
MNNKPLKDHLKEIEKQAYLDKKRINTFLECITFEKLKNILKFDSISNFKILTVQTNNEKSTEKDLNHTKKYIDITFKDTKYSFILIGTELTIYNNSKEFHSEKLQPFELNFKAFALKILLTILKTQ